jgi:ABC-type transport system substrate-binding protein
LKDDIRLKEIEIIQKNLKAIGILINVNLYDDMELFQEALVTQKFDMAIATVNMPISDYYDDLVKTRGALNFGGYSNSDIDTRLNELKNLNGQEIKQRTEELLKLITHEQVVTPIAYRDRVILVDDRIGGSIDPNMFDIYEKIITWNIGLE